MGADPELILLTTSALASVPAALGAVRSWLRVRRSTVHVKLTRKAGVVEVNAERVSPDRVFELVAEATKGLDGPKATPGEDVIRIQDLKASQRGARRAAIFSLAAGALAGIPLGLLVNWMSGSMGF